MRKIEKSIFIEQLKKTIKICFILLLVGSYPVSCSFAMSENGNGNANGNDNGESVPADGVETSDWVNALAMGVDNTGQKSRIMFHLPNLWRLSNSA